MAFSAAEIQELGYSSLNFFLRNNPVDNVAQERPLLKRLMAGKQSFPGGNDSIVIQARKGYDPNFQWFQGDATVTYNKKQTLAQLKFPWKGWHDGFQLSEDYLLSNGVTVTDSARPSSNSEAERLQLTNLFTENMETLRLGSEQQFDIAMHVAGSASAVTGLEALVALKPNVGTVGGIDRAVAANTWWRNQVKASAPGTLIDDCEAMWRQCIINGGAPNFIIAGAGFVDAFRTAAAAVISRYTVQQVKFDTPTEFDPSVKQGQGATYTGLHFQGVPITYDPTFEIIDAGYDPGGSAAVGAVAANKWTNRCYFLNMNEIKLRPASGHDMVPRKPPREYNNYIHRFAITWKGGLVMRKARCHGVITNGAIV